MYKRAGIDIRTIMPSPFENSSIDNQPSDLQDAADITSRRRCIRGRVPSLRERNRGMALISTLAASSRNVLILPANDRPAATAFSFLKT